MFHILNFFLFDLSLYQMGVWCKRVDANKIDQYLLFIPHTCETKTLSSILKSDILVLSDGHWIDFGFISLDWVG